MTKPAVTPQAYEKTILVVDDEQDVLIFLSTALEDAGFKVMTASDGFEALKLIKEKKPDFISTDLVMPDKSGIKFLYELRKNKEYSSIPVIVVTAHARDELGRGDLEEIMAGKIISGPQIYLEKPVKAEDFVRLVKQKLGIELTEKEAAKEEENKNLKEKVLDELKAADPKVLKQIMEMLHKKR